MAIDLPIVWAGIIGFAVLTYVLLDGFDLGLGILFPFAGDDAERDLMMNSVAPVWDGNETWLILGGGGLFAVFPLAYAVIMPALYIPVILMLLALVFRGVAFEYRWRTKRWRGVWDVAFTGGSTLAALMQGVSLGTIVQGIEVSGRAYAGGHWDWFTPFSLLVGVAVCTGYALLGATWLLVKTESWLQRRARRWAWWTGVATFGFVLLVSALTPTMDPVYATRWLTMPGAIITFVMPVSMAGVAWLLFTGLNDHRDLKPFLAALALFALCFIGIGVSFYPYLVPPSLTIHDVAAPDESLLFALVGTVVLVPMILAYTAYSYWVFRGKLDPAAGYH